MKTAKKSLILASALSLLLLSGCSNSQPQPQKPTNTFACQMEGAQAPQWVCGSADVEGGITAVGSAQPNAAHDIQFQREEAIAAARDALARRIQIKVKNMFKQFKSTTGAGENQTFDKATESVSKQVAAQTLNGSKLINTWISPKGTMFVLVGISDKEQLKENIKNAYKKAIKTSYKNDPALYQKFLSKKAQEELEQSIDKELGGNQ